MAAPGETDLAKMLADLAVERRPGSFTYLAVESPSASLLAAAHVVIVESALTTLVVPIEVAANEGLEPTGEMAWLTLTVQSSLDAVGLTAAFSARLGDARIPCNVLAGYHHDHILVPADRVDDAVAALEGRRGA